MSNKTVIFSAAYFPPTRYISEILSSDKIIIERYENYQKQSYRNRCEILSPNGKQTLSVPVIKKSGNKQLVKDVKIDYKTDWQSLHLKSLKTAYFSSPFFEFYIDAFLPFFEKKYTFLFDLNIEILQTLLNELEIKKEITFSEKYEFSYPFNDFRNSIHPKIKLNTEYFKPEIYTQVFFDRFNFVPNLSVLDLLFNEGPAAESFLIR